ncbi:MAG: 50S ribosomal protein L13 [Crenarchaeota archaeon]|nr:50S ribosomal protein L13 [Thermoproteota archaeon]
MESAQVIHWPGRNPPVVDEVVVDAAGCVAGRLASVVAKLALEGRRVTVVNAEKAIITGDFNMILNWYKKKLSEWRTHYNPEKAGPKIPRRPDRILKRIIRGMLPRKQWRGRMALKRIRVYMGIPPNYVNRKRIVFEETLYRPRPGAKYVTLEELWRHIEPHKWEMWKKAQEVWQRWLEHKAKAAQSKSQQ